MKRTILSAVILAATLFQLRSQTVDYAYADVRTGFSTHINPEETLSGFHVDYLNIHVGGKLADKLSYRLRHRLTLPSYRDYNPLNATDMALLEWRPTGRLRFVAGKQSVNVGGYEYDANPINVYFWSSFVNNLYQFFMLGACAGWELSEGQEISFQFCQSPLSMGKSNCFAYNFYWRGSIAPWWHTTWCLNFMDSEYDRFMHFITLGNHFRFGKASLEVDLGNRNAIGQKRHFFTDWSAVTDFKYPLGKFVLGAKFTYDFNSSENVDEYGDSFNIVLPAGTKHLMGAAGFEYYPLDDRRLRLHAFYSWSNQVYSSCNTLTMGLTWRMDFFRRDRR